MWRNKWIKVSLVLIALSVQITAAITHDDVQKAKDKQDALLRENRYRLQDEQPLFRPKSESIRMPQPRTVPSGASTPSSGPSFSVKTIYIDGVTRLSDHTIHRLKKHYEGTEMTTADIQRLVQAIIATYLDRGYMTTQVYIVPKNIADGILVLQVREGQIEKIVLKGSALPMHRTAFLGLLSRPLQASRVETRLSQMNRLPSYRTTVQFLPQARQPGYSILQLTTQKIAPLGRSHVTYRLKPGQKSPLLPRTYRVSRDQLMGLSDTWSLNYYQIFSENDQFTNSISLTGSIPIGGWIYHVSHTRYHYLNIIQGRLRTFTTSGSSITSQLSIDMPLAKLTLTPKLTVSETESFIEDVKSEVGSRQSVALDVGLRYAFLLTKGVPITVSMGHSGPIRAFNIPMRLGQTEVWRSAIGISFPLAMLPIKGQLSSQLTGQWVPSPIEGQDNIEIGSEYTVRGFSAPTHGDLGFYWRNDWRMPIRYNQMVTWSVDSGYVKAIDGPSSAGIGTAFSWQISWQYLTVNARIMKAIKAYGNLAVPSKPVMDMTVTVAL